MSIRNEICHRIKEMTDEEITEFIFQGFKVCEYCINREQERVGVCSENCSESVSEYVKRDRRRQENEC